MSCCWGVEGQEEESACTSNDTPHSAMSIEPLDPAGAVVLRPERRWDLAVSNGDPRGQSMSAVEIPVGLKELLQGYTVEVLRHRPPDLVEFAVQHFTHILNAQRNDQKAKKPSAGPARKAVTFEPKPSPNKEEEEEDEDDPKSELFYYPQCFHHERL